MAEPEWTETVDRARAGDVDAQGALLVQFTPLVRATATRLVPRDDVGDVIQETFAVAMAQLARLRTSAAFPAWLRLIARKQASRHRVPAATRGLHGIEAADRSPGPAEIAERREVAAVVRLALASARDHDRHVLELRYLAGWSTAELAEHLGISQGAVRKRLHDARSRMRPYLEPLAPKETPMTDLASFLGAIHRPDVPAPEPHPLRHPPGERTVTGLKVIDTIAPIRRGGTIEMVGPHGTGQVVLALELLYRLGRTPNDIACVAVGRAGTDGGSQPDLGHLVTEPDIPAATAAILYPEPDRARSALEAGGRLAGGLAHNGWDVLLLVDGPTVEHADTALSRYAGLTDGGSVTVVAVRPVVRGGRLPAPLALDATLTFSVEQFALGIFPAIDPTTSTSVLPASPAAATLRQQLEHAAKARAWFHQDLFVAADFTGRDGTWIEPADADEQLRALTR